MSRTLQVASWIVLAPVFGLIQAFASMFVPMLRSGGLASHDLKTVLIGLAIAYGGAWFIPALLVSDFLFLKRPISGLLFARYGLMIASAAVVMGFFLPGMLAMVGYPLTACAILLIGYMHRKARAPAGSGNLPI